MTGVQQEFERCILSKDYVSKVSNKEKKEKKKDFRLIFFCLPHFWLYLCSLKGSFLLS